VEEPTLSHRPANARGGGITGGTQRSAAEAGGTEGVFIFLLEHRVGRTHLVRTHWYPDSISPWSSTGKVDLGVLELVFRTCRSPILQNGEDGLHTLVALPKHSLVAAPTESLALSRLMPWKGMYDSS